MYQRLKIRYAFWLARRMKFRKHPEGYSLDIKRWYWWGWNRGAILSEDIMQQLREMAKPR